MTDMEQLAQWMLIQSIPTGHGDSMEGLLEELSVWVDELRAERYRLRDEVGVLNNALDITEANFRALKIERDRYRAALEEIVASRRDSGAWTIARRALGDD